jgi:CDGSH-type Zn-finger protein
MDLEQGKYLWCACGMSKDNPFCNGSHHGTSVKPVYFEVKKKRKMSLCTCKLTKTPPYCDGAHKFVDLLDITNKKEKVTTVT